MITVTEKMHQNQKLELNCFLYQVEWSKFLCYFFMFLHSFLLYIFFILFLSFSSFSITSCIMISTSFFLLFLLGCDKNHNSKFTWDQIRDPQKNCASGSEGNGSWVLYESLKAFYFLPFLWIPISTGEILISILKHM